MATESDHERQMPPPATTDAVAAAAAAAALSTEQPRPILKLNTSSRQPSVSGEPPSACSDRKTIKIKLGNSQPSTPATTSSVTKTKAGRPSKPTAKLVESKKRAYESDEDQPLATTRPAKSTKLAKIKVKPTTPGSAITPVTPISGIKVKPRGEPVEHKHGDAYDSEASDRETDPIRESVMVLRTLEGPSTEYLRKALEENTIGVPKANGGADLNVQFVDAKERRAMVTINGVNYAAVLVDLPTITEAMKTWDRKSMMKNSNVTQMLLCFAQVQNEGEARSIALPAMAQKTDLKWPHGLTPPMHDAVNQRFRKTMSENQLMNSAAMVKKLLADDAEAVETRVEYVFDDDSESDSGEDAEGEVDESDYFGHQPSFDHADIDEDDLEAEFEAAEAPFSPGPEEDMMESQNPATQFEASTPMTVEAGTPAAEVGTPAVALDEPSEGEEDEDISDEDDDDDEDLDDEEQAKQNERKEKLTELREFQTRLADLEAKHETIANAILKKRSEGNIANLKKEISVKKAALGITDDN